MVLYLVRDISLDLAQLRGTHRKRAIALLPRKLSDAMLMNPSRRTTLHLTNHISQRVCCPQSKQNVDVISGSADRPSNRTDITDNAADVGVQFLTPRFCNHPAAAFGGKNDVVVEA